MRVLRSARGGRLAVAVLVLLSPATAGARQTEDGVAGHVVDPQDRRVAGAVVRLRCEDSRREAITDGSGAFTFAGLPPTAPCALTVTAPGFSPASATVKAQLRPWIVRLRLAPLVESIDVRPATPLDTTGRLVSSGITVRGDQLRTVSNDPDAIVRYATALAGGGAGGHAIYVDGLPATQIPPLADVASITVGADPFSAEYSDPAHQRIDIVTTVPDRRWRFSAGATPPIVGARNPIAPDNAPPRSRSIGGGIAGPAPWTGGSFSTNVHFDMWTFAPAIVAAVPVEPSVFDAAVVSRTTLHSLAFGVHQQWSPRTALRAQVLRTDERDAGNGVGAEILSEAATDRASAATETRVSLSRQWNTGMYRSDVLIACSRETIVAGQDAVGVWVPGAFIAGGAPMRSVVSRRVDVTWKNVVSSRIAGRPWRTGVIFSRASAEDRRLPNQAGHLLFPSTDAWMAARAGAATATLFRFVGATDQHLALNRLAAFVETPLLQREHVQVNWGLRADAHSLDRAAVSPRLFGVFDVNGWIISGGAGVFLEDWRTETFLGTTAAGGDCPVQMISPHVSIADGLEGDAPGGRLIAAVAPGFTRPRYLVTTTAVGRSFGGVAMRAEHVWRTSRHLAGSRRLRDEAGWADWLESNRAGSWHEVRARVGASWRDRSVVVNYSWIRAADDTDGPFSFPARQDAPAAEWARATRIPSHSVDLVASATVPGVVRASLVASARSGAPYNIVSGVDVEGNGLQADRGGRPRNSGLGAPYRSVSLYLHRRFGLSPVLGRATKAALDAGLQIDNLFDAHRWTAYGTVAGSPLFNRPEAALPGRSLRVWFSIVR